MSLQESNGKSRLDILLFTLGSTETYGINVFKVREVVQTPPITRTPNMPPGVCGLVSLRGKVFPVVSLIDAMGLQPRACKTLMVVEFSRRTLGFLVDSVDRILSVDWAKVFPPTAMTSGDSGGFSTAVTELDDGRLVSILDVEGIIDRTLGETKVDPVDSVPDASSFCVFYVDDSLVARRRIADVLTKMGVSQLSATNGQEAWRELSEMADKALLDEVPLSSRVTVIMVDAEMPGMDGYELTKHIRGDDRFAGIPVIMHSSLSAETNRIHGQKVGVAAYVLKFSAQDLADTLRPHLK